MSELISVVIPVYNVEAYVSRCIDSVLKQSVQNYEIILVDDGSSDTSGDICDAYAQKFPEKIRTYHKRNGGLSDARNFGVGQAKGNWITFIDSDDYVDTKYLQTLYYGIKEGRAQISCCDYLRTESNENICEDSECSIEIYTEEEIQKEYLKKELVSACGKLYSAVLCKKVPFPIGKINEDIDTVFKIFSLVKTVVYIDKKMYFYYKNTNSITKQKFSKKNLDLLDAWYKVLQLSKSYSPEIQELARFRYQKAYFTLLGMIAYYGMQRTEENLQIKSMLLTNFKKNLSNLLLRKEIPFNRKLAMVAMAFSFNTCCIAGALLRKVKM